MDVTPTMMEHAPQIAAAGLAIAAALTACRLAAAWSRWQREGEATITRSIDLPWLLRVIHPLLHVIAQPLAAVVPHRAREATRSRLNRLEIEDALSTEEFLSASLVGAAVGVMVAHLVAHALSTPLAAPGALAAAFAGASWPWLWLRDLLRRADHAITRELPATLDQLILAIEAGCALPAALRVCAEQSAEGVLQRALSRALQQLRAGQGLQDALASMAARLDQPAVTVLVATLTHSIATGSRLGPQLRAQADQRSEERFARAERLAAQSPVKMLAPLLLCMFPCTFLVIGFPILSRLLEWR